MNEGLEIFEGCNSDDLYGGAFSGTRIKKIIFPSTLKVLGNESVSECNELKYVTFREECLLEEIGSNCFCSSGIEEITIPSSVIILCKEAFRKCKSLKRVLF